MARKSMTQDNVSMMRKAIALIRELSDEELQNAKPRTYLGKLTAPGSKNESSVRVTISKAIKKERELRGRDKDDSSGPQAKDSSSSTSDFTKPQLRQEAAIRLVELCGGSKKQAMNEIDRLF